MHTYRVVREREAFELFDERIDKLSIIQQKRLSKCVKGMAYIRRACRERHVLEMCDRKIKPDDV